MSGLEQMQGYERELAQLGVELKDRLTGLIDFPSWMNGREVYKFAVNKFREVIEDALEKTSLSIYQVSQFVCHQSNVRIIDAAK